MKKLLTRLALLMILCAALALPVFADAVTDSISVCIGYFGWSEDEYVEKAKFSWQELDDWYGGALDTHEEYYSYCNGSGRTYLAFARGFYIRDLLDYAGVERWNVFDEPVLPDAARRKMYERYYREYLELYRSLKPNMERMATVVKELNGGGDERGR